MSDGLHKQIAAMAERIEALLQAIEDVETVYMEHDGSPTESAAHAFEWLRNIAEKGEVQQ